MIAAVVPMKPFARAKQRLSPILAERDRLALVRTMLSDVLAALCGCRAIDETFVVTADPEVAAFAARRGAGDIAEDMPAGLDGAVATAARYIETRGSDAMLVVPGDVPLVTPAELDELAALSRPQGMTIVPAHDRDGTNALLLSPPGAIYPAFGPGSFTRHVDAGHAAGLNPATCPLEDIGRDIDGPDDLRILAERTAGRPEYDFLRGRAASAHRREPQDA